MRPQTNLHSRLQWRFRYNIGSVVSSCAFLLSSCSLIVCVISPDKMQIGGPIIWFRKSKPYLVAVDSSSIEASKCCENFKTATTTRQSVYHHLNGSETQPVRQPNETPAIVCGKKKCKPKIQCGGRERMSNINMLEYSKGALNFAFAPSSLMQILSGVLHFLCLRY